MTDLDARYGASRNRPATRPNRWWWVLVAAMTVGVVIFWALSVLNPSATIETQTGRFIPVSDTVAEMDARVSVQPGTPLACAVEAQSAYNAVVGFGIYELPPTDEQHQTLSVTLRTTQPATLVQIRECWIP